MWRIIIHEEMKELTGLRFPVRKRWIVIRFFLSAQAAWDEMLNNYLIIGFNKEEDGLGWNFVSLVNIVITFVELMSLAIAVAIISSSFSINLMREDH
jgi:hypothetical protein